jgi:hypothetical protein
MPNMIASDVPSRRGFVTVVARASRAIAALALASCPGSATDPSDLVLDHVNVIDVVTGDVLADRRVSIAGGRIVGVSPAGAEPPARRESGRVLDLRGRYVMPGLWDMHVHIDTTERWFFPLAVAAGVTGVRDMGGHLERTEMWKQVRRVADSAVVSDSTGRGSDEAMSLRPMVLAAGPIVTGAVDDPDPRVVHVSDASRAAGIADSLLDRGADFVKVHDWLAPNVYRALAARARARGTHLAGHLPLHVDPNGAGAARQRSIEHLGNGWGLLSLHATGTTAFVDSLRGWARTSKGPPDLVRHFTPAWYGGAADAFDTTRAVALARQLARDSVWVTPTLYFSYWLQLAPLDSSVITDSRLGYLPPSVRAMLPYLAPTDRLRPLPDTAPTLRFFRVQQTLTRILAREGVALLAGTDVGPYAPMIPGFSLHDELSQLVSAGLPPRSAIRAATIEPARYLGLADSVGRVASGYRADLVVLDDNPLEEIRSVARVHAVVVGGTLLSSAARTRLLEQLRAQFARR